MPADLAVLVYISTKEPFVERGSQLAKLMKPVSKLWFPTNPANGARE
jgi:hypothetical protein